MANFGKQKKVTVGGVEYTLQHPGVKRAFEITDDAMKPNQQVPSMMKLFEAYMKDVIVEPKTDWDYWDEKPPNDVNELMQEVDSFLRGEEN
ncbi:hypothetical protein [Heyndrickxia sporothermodurans]|uniref:hypothetical protein n=1 Tax=Heyndrickxia sporothermodurans TaxID=46224 RepID=UPI0035DA0728